MLNSAISKRMKPVKGFTPKNFQQNARHLIQPGIIDHHINGMELPAAGLPAKCT